MATDYSNSTRQGAGEVRRTILTAPLASRFAVIMTAACVIYAVLHICTIVRSRQVWFDETFFASIAHSFEQTGELSLPVSPLWIQQHVYLYGPVYFIILGTVFRIFGIGIVQTRLPGLLFGFALLGVTFLILRHEKVRRSIALTACILLAIDPTFHQNVHSGRTDSTALFFLFSAFLLLLKSRDAAGTSGIWWCIGSGILGALGVLTTPRPGYLLIPMGLILLARWYRRPTVYAALQPFAWGLALSCVYGIWVLYAFGSIGGLIEYYSRFAETYAGGGQIRLLQVPLLVILLGLVAVILFRAPRQLLSELTVFGLFGVAAFYVFVKSGPPFGQTYTFLLIVPGYIALASLLSDASQLLGERRKRFIAYGCFGLLFLVNGSAFLARTVLEIAEWERRDPKVAEEFIRDVVPPGSRVVGDDQFYFAVKRNGADFQYIERGGTLTERVAYHRDVFQFDYMITSRADDSEILHAYIDGVGLKQIAEIEAPPTSELGDVIAKVARALGVSAGGAGVSKDSFDSGYHGRIFARAR